MNLKEHDDNRFTKEKDKVEQYLQRIIQRYFEVENNYTKESIEAMIIEALTRVKRDLVSNKGFVFSLNQRTGHIVLNINDFNGELAFDKNNAFNKDFGTEAGTICEGNDERLSDKREPLEHVHTIGNINELNEILSETGIDDSSHLHSNGVVLKAIKYTGSSTQIDLAVLEYLENKVNEAFKNLQFYQRELNAVQKKYLETLSYYIPTIKQELQMAKDIVNNTVSWLQDIYDYTAEKTNSYKFSTIQEMVAKYLDKSRVKDLLDNTKSPFCIISDGEIPLTEGTVSCVPVQIENVTTKINDAQAIKEFYTTATALNTSKSSWSTTTKSSWLSSNSGGGSFLGMLISAEKYDSYTFRTVLSSHTYVSINGVGGIVLAYDETTNKNLSILCSTGGETPPGLTGTTAVIVLNYSSSSGDLDGELRIDAKSISDKYTDWEYLTHGITILVKRNKNNFKIWLLYDKEHNWNSTIQDGVEDIYPTEAPTFEFNLEDYPELYMFVNKKCNYGYGTRAQQIDYNDICFINNIIYSEPYGHTNINESNKITYSIPESIMNQVQQSRVKMFFRYDNEDGQTVTTPLPFNSMNENNSITVINGSYTQDGDIIVDTNFMNKLELYTTDDNIYSQDTIIGYNNIDANDFYYVNTYLNNIGCTLCEIDSEAKNNFVSQMLPTGVDYYIDGYKSYVNNLYYNANEEQMSYFNWDTGNPSSVIEEAYIITNSTGKWKSTRGGKKYGFIAEFKIKKLMDYYDNPRIYYQVLGNKEVV